MRPKGMKDLVVLSARKVKRAAAANERDEYSTEEGVKVIPASFLKIEGRGTLVGAKDRRERDK